MIYYTGESGMRATTIGREKGGKDADQIQAYNIAKR